VNARVMLSMASGVLDGDCLTVLCRDDFTQKQLDKPEILTVLRDVTAAELGRDIRVMLAVGKAPPASGRSAPPPPPSRQAPQPAPQAAAPAPPANDPPGASRLYRRRPVGRAGSERAAAGQLQDQIN